MSFWVWLTGGHSMPVADTPGQRLALRVGYRLATRHRRVTADPTCRFSPEARIHPRGGSIVFGPHCLVAAGAIVQGAVTCGAHCSVQAYSILVGYPGGEITLGDHVRIAPQVMLIGADHVFADPGRPIREQGLRPAPIVIEDDVWVAGRVTVCAGVTIGRGAVVAAGAVVTRDVSPYTVVGGVPARVIKERSAP